MPGRSAVAGARRILVLRLDNIGDVVMTGPALRALRAAEPDAELVLLASPAGSSAAPLLPWLDRVEVARVVWQDAHGRLPLDPARELALVERVRALDADAAIVMTSFSQTAWPAGYLAYLAGIRVRAGHADDFGGGVLSHPVPGPAPVHQVDRNLHLLAGLGVAAAGRHLEIRIDPVARARVATLLGEASAGSAGAGSAGAESPILVLPGASASARRYPAGRFARAAAILQRRTGRPVIVAGSEAEAPLVEAVVAEVAGAVPLAGRTSVAELAALIERAGVVLANDSLGMHLADALGRPVVVPFSGTDREAEWRPRRAPAVLLREPTTCAPCRRLDCPIGLPCLDIPAEALAAAAMVLLAGDGTREELACAG